MAQRVLVTAGASGIGREIARAFAANRASVFVCDIDAKALDVLAGEITGLKIGICDVSNRADIDAAKSISGQMAPIDNDMQQAS